MKIGLIDVDSHNFPNLALMKLSAYHKKIGNEVGWYDGSWCDTVYMSKVFSFSKDFKEPVHAGEVIRGGDRILYRCGSRQRVLEQTRYATPL